MSAVEGSDPIVSNHFRNCFRNAAFVLIALAIVQTAEAGTRRIRLISISFEVPVKMDVEGAGSEEVFAMKVGKCEGQCPPILMAWECHMTAEPKCSDLRRTPPEDMCANAGEQEIAHSPALKERRWDCGVVTDTDGSTRVGFSVFALGDRQFAISYIGGLSDATPAEFFDFLAKTIAVK